MSQAAQESEPGRPGRRISWHAMAASDVTAELRVDPDHGLKSGEVLEITATDPGSVKDMESFCHQTGNELVSASQADGNFVYRIRKV